MLKGNELPPLVVTSSIVLTFDAFMTVKEYVFDPSVQIWVTTSDLGNTVVVAICLLLSSVHFIDVDDRFEVAKTKNDYPLSTSKS